MGVGAVEVGTVDAGIAGVGTVELLASEDGWRRDWMDSGVAALTGALDGPALIPPGGSASFARACGDHLRRATSGVVDVDGAALLGERAAFTGRQRAGDCSVGGATRLLAAGDGAFALTCARSEDVDLIGAMVGREVDAAAVFPAVAEWAADLPCSQVLERIRLLGLAGGIVGETTAPPEGYSLGIGAPGATRLGSGASPMAGRLVVDFSALWAGPLCAHLLGAAGAEVVKVEIPTRPDGARQGNRAFYDLLHGGHRSVVLDPADTTERELLYQVVAAADIVIEASRPRALRGFGLDADRFVADGTTWISITAHGRRCNRIGFGDDVAATAGLVAADSVGRRCFVGDAIADPLTGLWAAVCAISGDAGDRGQLWDIAMADVVRASTQGAGSVLEHPQSRGAPTRVAKGRGSVGGVEPPPRHRRVCSTAPDFGADTRSVLADLGLHPTGSLVADTFTNTRAEVI